LDGAQYFTVNANQVDGHTWPMHHHGFFVILNVAMGGGWPGNPTASTASGVRLNVDYVRVFYATLAAAAVYRTRTAPNGWPSPTLPNTPVVAVTILRGQLGQQHNQARSRCLER